MAEREDIRTTISWSKTVDAWAQELMRARGFNGNTSQFVASLIRAEKDREDAKVIALNEALQNASEAPYPPLPPEKPVRYKQPLKDGLKSRRQRSSVQNG